MTFDDVIQHAPFSLDKSEKEQLLTRRLLTLTSLHRDNCSQYRDILDGIGYDEEKIGKPEDVPFLPVRLFKDLDLKSIPDDQIVKTMTSSGTSGQKVSKIYLDRNTASNQQKTMVKIVSDFTGAERMPMIIIDCPSVIKNRNLFSARGAGILGFSMFGTKKIYALNDDMSLDLEGIKAFLETHAGKPILLFGFTYMIWQYFYKELLKYQSRGMELDLSSAILIHGGGWKKLIDESVSQEEFRAALNRGCKIDRVHDYYGMVEQTGCIYMQCECGHLHASIFSDVIIRDPRDFSVCPMKERGIIQTVSTIPESYPGHSLLTEDEGAILGEDDCPCGRKGKYFEIYGRIKKAEIRGCSDTFAASVTASQKDTMGSIRFLIGNESSITNAGSILPMKPFSEKIVDFCNALSGRIMKSREARQYPDVATLGFWLRKSSVMKMSQRIEKEDALLTGRGMLFHIAPSNVPVNYAYSLFAGLLCGNANIVRVPTKDFPQVKIINDLISETLEEYPEMQPYITLVRYDRDKKINDALSAVCDVRVIWGGDETIKTLRESPIPPRTTEVTFSDRYSIALFDSDEFMKRAEDEGFVSSFISDFYNDTYLSDQNACTSPRVIVWTGNRAEEAKALFWMKLQNLVTEKYQIQPVQSVDKISALCMAAAQKSSLGIRKLPGEDNRIYRVRVQKADASLMDYKGHSGFFYEFDCKDVRDMIPLCHDTRCQTLALLGSRELVRPLFEAGVKGIDRVVAVGHTMDFELIWDGYDLMERFTRKVRS